MSCQGCSHFLASQTRIPWGFSGVAFWCRATGGLSFRDRGEYDCAYFNPAQKGDNLGVFDKSCVERVPETHF